MTVALLKAGDHDSLEFATTDLDTVRACIRAFYGKVSSKAAGMATVVTFGGESFTFQDEWDDPCLISHSVKGNDRLRAIHAHFHVSQGFCFQRTICIQIGKSSFLPCKGRGTMRSMVEGCSRW
ncbi:MULTISPECIES: hypothetical protein [Sphingomonas]|jgi:hypothetical protein|nr:MULTISPECIES: hypothetical protein [Sphingomonas]